MYSTNHEMRMSQKVTAVDVILCRYNYTVYQDSEHGRQKIVKDSVDTLISVVDSVSCHPLRFA